MTTAHGLCRSRSGCTWRDGPLAGTIEIRKATFMCPLRPGLSAGARRLPALILAWGLWLPETVRAATVSVDLGAADSARGLRNSQRGNGTDGENDPGTCGPTGDLRSGRTNRG